MAEWVELGTDEMQKAQDRLGLSNERLAAELFIVSKTWERWKKSGRVPRHQLQHVADVLELQVEAPEPVRLARPLPRSAAAPAERLSQIDERLARIEEALGISRAEPNDAPSGRAEDA